METIDYTLNIAQGLGRLNFNATEQDVINWLGVPEKTEKDLPGTVDYFYNNKGIHITFFYFENDHKTGKPLLDDLQIRSDKVIYNGKNLYELQKTELLNLVKQIHKQQNAKYEFDYELHELDEDDHEEYSFDNIGLRLWFDREKLDDVCIYKPE